jgi:hypothetical protein
MQWIRTGRKINEEKGKEEETGIEKELRRLLL